LLVSICTGVLTGAAWDFQVDVCEKDKRLDGVLRELASATATAILEDPENVKGEESKSALFIRIPDDKAAGLYCANVGCYVLCADWMLVAYSSVTGPCCDAHQCAHWCADGRSGAFRPFSRSVVHGHPGQARMTLG
jgi:hypothetical protein